MVIFCGILVGVFFIGSVIVFGGCEIMYFVDNVCLFVNNFVKFIFRIRKNRFIFVLVSKCFMNLIFNL